MDYACMDGNQELVAQFLKTDLTIEVLDFIPIAQRLTIWGV